MSDRRNQRDSGMTLPELLIAVSVLGLIMTVLASGLTVTLRQMADTRGRVDVARWEQNLGMWLPDDLTSAETDKIDSDPEATPCGAGAGSCFGIPMTGSNVLLLVWTEGSVTTSVSYRYMEDGDGTFGLFRVACIDGSCTTRRVLGDLGGPTDAQGDPVAFHAGDPVPASVVDVDFPTVAAGADASVVCPDVAPTDPVQDPCDRSVGQRRVIVTVNGQPAADGTLRSSRLTLAAGGTELGTLAPPAFTAPSATPARSECGGPITVVVDRSGSIGSAMGDVRDGLVELVNVLDGTPTQLQIIDFSDRSNALGPATTWNEYFDMSDTDSGPALIRAIGGLRTANLTNWEDALFRTFFTADGTPHSESGIPTAPMPSLVVLFTDGLPTVDRQSGHSYRSDTASRTTTEPIPAPYLPTEAHSPWVAWMSPRAWYRADDIAARVRGLEGDDAVRIVGVGVGSEFGNSRQMYDNRGRLIAGWPPVGTLLPHAKFLGNLVTGGEPTDSTDFSYNERVYSDATGWGDLTDVDLLRSARVTDGARALALIALEQCGGTLTVQTKLADGRPAPFDVTYESEAKQVTTSRGAKSGTFDVPMSGLADRTVTVVPETGGHQILDWVCRTRGDDIPVGDDFSPVQAGDLAQGITVNVNANGAVSCTMTVAS